MRKIAISDIHGCSKTFRAMLEDVLQFSKEDKLYLLGDYVDRGPDSKGVLDYIMELKADDYQVHCLMGNHEAMMLEARVLKEETPVWRFNGGIATMQSFSATSISQIPQHYFDFLNEMEDYMLVDDYILVHAGLNFQAAPDNRGKRDFLWKVKNPLVDRKSLLWIRDWYDEIDRDWLGERIIIHGHTPISEAEIRGMREELKRLPVLDIDNGCFARYQTGMGSLCAFDMTNHKLYFQENIE
jgi:serine/threonine protein phosphatase 1